MKKVVIVGGGIAGLTAGVLLSKAGFETEIYEKNAVPGGLCSSWQRDGFRIDNCIHWLTGTRPGSALHELWKEVGALGADVPLYEKKSFYASELDGQTLTFWRDKERTRQEMLALSPEDAAEIHRLIKAVSRAESLPVPVEKPFDAMNPLDFIKLALSMKDAGKVMKDYGGMDLEDLALRFRHPLIRCAITDYMPRRYPAYAFIVSYAAVTGGNGDIPLGGSLAMAERMAGTFRKYGGRLYTGEEVAAVCLDGRKATGIRLRDGREVPADYVICACDTDAVFHGLLPEEWMPSALRAMYENPEAYPVNSGFQVALALDEIRPEMTGTQVFSCRPLTIATREFTRMDMQSYEYDPSFAPAGQTVIQSSFLQTGEDYEYWQALAADQAAYAAKKAELAEAVRQRLIEQYRLPADRLRVLDVWTPMTYHRRCHAYRGAYLRFVTTKDAKSVMLPGTIKGLDNVWIAGQWLMSAGGLPSAAATGRFAAWRILHREPKR